MGQIEHGPDTPFGLLKVRLHGFHQVLAEEFNCLWVYSDIGGKKCSELWYMDTKAERYTGAMKTPTLRNVADRPPYMRAGQFASLREVLEFYRKSKNPEIGHLNLTDQKIRALEAFLKTLSGPVIALGE